MKIGIIVAGGKGERMKQFGSKQFIPLAGKPLIVHSLEAFEKANLIDAVILVVRAEQIERAEQVVAEGNFIKVVKVVAGGKERQDSSYEGIKMLPEAAEIAAIHDGARPLVTSKLIDQVIATLGQEDGLVVGVPVKDTIKKVAGNLVIKKTAERAFLWTAQTPQVFKVTPLKIAYEKAMQQGYYATDDCSLLEREGYQIKIFPGTYDNVKITTPEDLVVAEEILRRRSVESRDRI